ncbi:MatE efflux family protein [Butyrivibrio proteoclasticus B316]|uniref:MatE efflux family protein n=1 Tax=Butyrivibrio proteoclasticus (strain ATCC 51982 / DSM 14932 / B316) TaxID=515622 RepID=E0RW82_BUTPB|nr:MATE family efflux transporter [Butyrivibrio proteoclasticus]ADL32948.1 MatE efflux family protein [Butyrivibrio proteoclasticus B316]
MTKTSNIRDLTVGDPMKLIMGFAMSLFWGMLFQQLYNIIDTAIVSWTLGKEAYSGMGSTGAVNFLIMGFCMGVCNGFAIPIAQRFGARDYKSMRKFFTHAIILCSVFAVVMTFFVSIFCKQILVVMRTPDSILTYAYKYIIVIFLGIPATYMYNLLSATIRALGDSKHPVQYLIIGSVANIAFDLLFILVFHWGIFGAAFATVVSQLIAGTLCLLYIVRKIDILRLSKVDWQADKSHFLILLNMGVPMGLQYSITAIGSVILQTAINGLGEDAVTAVTTASKVSMFFCIPFDALGSTMATYGGQNVGAKKLDHLTMGLRAAVKIGSIYSILAFVVLAFFGRNFAMIFLDASEVTCLDNAHLFLIYNSLFYIPLALVNIVRFLIQGMGYSMFAVLAGVMEMIGRSLVAVLLVPHLGFTAICLASPVAWILADAFLIPAFITVRNKLQRIFNGQVEVY